MKLDYTALIPSGEISVSYYFVTLINEYVKYKPDSFKRNSEPDISTAYNVNPNEAYKNGTIYC